MRNKRTVSFLLCVALAIALVGCAEKADIRDYKSFSGNMFLVGEETDIGVDMQYNGILEFRVTEKSVLREDEKTHRADIAAINENKITMLKSGRYKLWAITENVRYLFYYDIWGIDIGELKSEKRTGNEFETTVYFQEKVNYGEDFPFAVFNKNITDKTLTKTTPYLDPYKGAPGVAIYTIIDGYRLNVGYVEAAATMIGNYIHAPDQESRLLRSFAPVIERNCIVRLSDGKFIPEDDPFLATLGFEPNLYHEDHEKNDKIREELWAELKTRYNISDPEYNREWKEIYDAYPIYNPLYSDIFAPKGFYNIELGGGRVIENAFQII
jgi:hypothetical protein